MTRDPRHLIGAISGQREGPTAGPDRPRDAWSVSEVVGRIERALHDAFGTIEVIGEISSFKRWRNGHWYFDLRDRGAVLPCMMRNTHNLRVDFAPEDGMQVLAQGRVALYRQQGKAQLMISRLSQLGRGQLLEKLERIKTRLREEGLFDPARKRPLPTHPTRVGVVTSPQGAALQDILKVLRTRCPSVSVLLSPTRVQGNGASRDIAEALRRLDGLGRCDVIIIGRGGGALEDLMGFNMEVVARAIAGCQTPVISSVGHETDVTLADLAADARAATPTHAAQLAVQETAQLLDRLAAAQRHLLHPTQLALQAARHRLNALARRLDDSEHARLKAARRHSSELGERLSHHAPHRALASRRARLVSVRSRLVAAHPAGRMDVEHQRLETFGQRLSQAMVLLRRDAGHQLSERAGRLDALSPLRVLERGYALVEGEEQLHTTVASLQVGEEVKLRFADGAAAAKVTGVEPLPSSTDPSSGKK